MTPSNEPGTKTLCSAAELGEAYLTALQAKDRDAILALLAEDFALEVPCNISGTNDFSDSWHGLEAARANYDQTFRTIEDLRYTELEFTPGRDSNVAFAEGLGVMKMANGGRTGTATYSASMPRTARSGGSANI